MKGDFSRDTFDSAKHFSRVLLQQGRVLVDADWNEQASILLHHLRTLTADLVGPHAGPSGTNGFEVWPAGPPGTDFYIGGGRYYVEGILCENANGPMTKPAPPAGGKPAPSTWTSYEHQPDWWPAKLEVGHSYFIYLDVWERLITSVEDPELHEVALGDADTAARAQIVWQVKAAPFTPTGSGSSDEQGWEPILADLRATNRGRLRASVRAPAGQKDPCVIPRTSQYRGENQLWRIEVHEGGEVGTATFKVSYDNGSVVFPVTSVAALHPTTNTLDKPSDPQFKVTLAHLGKDERTTLTEGDWVELVDNRYALQFTKNEPWAPDGLLRVELVDPEDMSVTLSGISRVNEAGEEVLLRRWDHRGTELDVVQGGSPNDIARGTFLTQKGPFALIDGIQLEFQTKDDGGTAQIYRPGDYWLIPAREATGDIEWPKDQFLGPRGIVHHYAPLATLTLQAGSSTASSLRTTFSINQTPPSPPDANDPGIGAEEL